MKKGAGVVYAGYPYLQGQTCWRDSGLQFWAFFYPIASFMSLFVPLTCLILLSGWEVIAEDETKEADNHGSLTSLDISSPGMSGHKQGHGSGAVGKAVVFFLATK